MRKSRSFLGSAVLLCLLLVFAVACGGGQEGPKTYQVKEDAKAGKSTWRVLSVKKAGQFDKKDGSGIIKAQGTFILVEAEVKNGSSEAAVLTGEELEIFDEENKAFSFDSRNNAVYLGAIGKDNLIAGPVDAGNSVKGFIIFDVDKDTKKLRLKARDLDIRSDEYVFIDLGT